MMDTLLLLRRTTGFTRADSEASDLLLLGTLVSSDHRETAQNQQEYGNCFEVSVHTIFLRTGRGPGKQLVNAMRILGLKLPSNLVSHRYLSSVLFGSDTKARSSGIRCMLFRPADYTPRPGMEGQGVAAFFYPAKILYHAMGAKSDRPFPYAPLRALQISTGRLPEKYFHLETLLPCGIDS